MGKENPRHNGERHYSKIYTEFQITTLLNAKEPKDVAEELMGARCHQSLGASVTCAQVIS